MKKINLFVVSWFFGLLFCVGWLLGQNKQLLAIVGEELNYNPESPEVVVSLPTKYSTDECYLANDQLQVVRYSYWYGKPFDVGYTLAAIAIQESNAGRWPVNLQDPSAGDYHVTLDKVLTALDWEETEFNLNRAAALLVLDRDFSASLAVKELVLWREHHAGNWEAIWASYHKGGRGLRNINGKAYAGKIRNLIQKTKVCGWVEGL